MKQIEGRRGASQAQITLSSHPHSCHLSCCLTVWVTYLHVSKKMAKGNYRQWAGLDTWWLALVVLLEVAGLEAALQRKAVSFTSQGPELLKD